MPETIKKTNEVKPEMAKEPPASVLAINFNTEQLPVMDAAEGGQVDGDKGSGVVDVGGSNNQSAKQFSTEAEKPVKVEQPKTEVAKEVTKEEVKDDKTESAPKTDDTTTKLPSFLKPPASKKADNNTDTKETKEVKTEPKIGEGLKPNDIDYTGLTQVEVGHLKNMNVQARKFTVELIKNNRELSKLKDTNYLQHPDAYLLSPEYRQLVFNSTAANSEADFWAQQLVNCKNLKKVFDIKGIDNATGNIIPGNQYEPSDALEEQIRMNMMNARRVMEESGSKLKEYPNRYKGAIDNDLSVIRQEVHNRFAWVSNPEVAEYTMSVPMNDGKVVDKTLKQIGEDFAGLFPVYLRNNPVMDVAKNFMIALAVRDAEMREMRKELESYKVKGAESRRVEPSGNNRPIATPKVNGVSEFSLAGAGVEGL